MFEVVPLPALQENFNQTLGNSRHAEVFDACGDTMPCPELGAAFSVLDIPGNTRAHVGYYGAGALFRGDVLLSAAVQTEEPILVE